MYQRLQAFGTQASQLFRLPSLPFSQAEIKLSKGVNFLVRKFLLFILPKREGGVYLQVARQYIFTLGGRSMTSNKKATGARQKLAGGMLLSAAAAAATAAALSGGAGTANATCASISGFGNGGGCTSAPGGFAVGIGPNTTATASAPLSAAVANGLGNGATDKTTATAAGAFNLAYAGGKNASATALGGPFNVAFTQGDNSNALAAGIGNIAANVGSNSTVLAGGVGNLAANFGDGTKTAPNLVAASGIFNTAFNTLGAGNIVAAQGVGNSAANFFGDNNIVQAAGGTPDLQNPLKSTFGGNFAFSSGGSKNKVTAGPSGPFSIAGVLGLSNKTVTQNGTGVNIKSVLNP